MGKVITEYSIGDLVYLRTDPEQKERMVIQIMISEDGVSYNLAFGTTSSWHFTREICSERDIKTVIDNY